MCFFVYLLYVLYISAIETINVKSQIVFDINPDGQLDNESYASLHHLQDYIVEPISKSEHGVPEIQNFTISVWVFVRLFSALPTVFSYATSLQLDNALTLYLAHEKIDFFYMSESIVQEYRIEPQRWYHIAITKERNFVRLFIDSVEIFQRTVPDLSLPMNGTLIIGQDQDFVGGGFSKAQTLSGKISSMTVWKTPFNDSQIKQLWISSLPLKSDLFQQILPWILHGNSRKLPEHIINDKIKVLVISQRHKFIDIERICDNINMTLFTPVSEEEVDLAISILKKVSMECFGVYANRRVTWLGSMKKENGTTWYDPVRNLTVHLNLSYTASIVFPEDLGNYRMLLGETRNAYASGYRRDAYCGMCTQYSLNTDSLLYIRGLCTQSYDHFIELFPRTKDDGSLTLVGKFGLTVTFEQRSANLIHFPTNLTIANITSTMVWGNHKWNIYILEDSCSYEGTEFLFETTNHYRQETLTISNCRNDEFPCGDGSCQPMKNRCSYGLDCTDGSDEEDCFIIHTHGSPNIAPPSDPFEIGVQLYVKILSVDAVNQLIKMKFHLSMTWYDSRLQFKNLGNFKESSQKCNLIPNNHFGEVWTPQIKILEEDKLDGKAVIDRTLHVRRHGKPKRILRDYLYEGAENPLSYHQEIQTKIHCGFNLQFFPFDKHNCQLSLILNNIYEKELYLWNTNETRIPKQILNEYTSTNASISFTNNMILYTFILKRQTTFHLFSTYFPTMLMHAIGFGTLFIRADDFQDRGAFSLTTLLVLISLYTDTLVTLPVTSYLKHIDIWFIFSFTFLSIVIAVHIATNNPGTKTEGRKIAWTLNIDTDTILRRARFIIGTGYMIFFFIYWGLFFVSK